MLFLTRIFASLIYIIFINIAAINGQSVVWQYGVDDSNQLQNVLTNLRSNQMFDAGGLPIGLYGSPSSLAESLVKSVKVQTATSAPFSFKTCDHKDLVVSYNGYNVGAFVSYCNWGAFIKDSGNNLLYYPSSVSALSSEFPSDLRINYNGFNSDQAANILRNLGFSTNGSYTFFGNPTVDPADLLYRLTQTTKRESDLQYPSGSSFVPFSCYSNDFTLLYNNYYVTAYNNGCNLGFYSRV